MAYGGTPINVTGATCKIGTNDSEVDVAKEGTVDATINTNTTSEELTVWGSYPFPEVVSSSTVATGTVNYIPDVATSVVTASTTKVSILIAATGFLFDCATCVIESASVTLGPGAAKGTFTFKTSGTYSITAP